MEETNKTQEQKKEQIVEETEEEVEETKEELKIEDVVKAYEDELSSIKFFTDQTKFNSIMYQGMNIILQKLTNIEENLDGNKK